MRRGRADCPADKQPQRQLAYAPLLLRPNLFFQRGVHVPQDFVLLAEERFFFLTRRRVAVQLGDDLCRGLPFSCKGFPNNCDFRYQSGVIGDHLADVTLRSLYLPALGERCGSLRRR